jgi:glycosyltransferase involved in cell wall biosynthesis
MAAPPRLYLDLSRLIYAVWTRTPVGIPRVELAYAEYLLATCPDRLTFVVMDMFGRLRILETRRAAEFVAAIADYWREGVGSNTAYARLVMSHSLIHTELLVRWGSLAETVAQPDGAGLYIIPSQLHMERPKIIRAVKKTGRLRLAYFVHDILPVTYPEYFPADAEKRCRLRMQAAAHHANYIIANSQTTAKAFESGFVTEQHPVSIVVAPLGLSPLAQSRQPPPRRPNASPYFVMVGTIEPRKNHLLILNIWRRLANDMGLSAPRLIVVGSRGWENENVVDMLERTPSFRGLVEERRRASDEEVTQLLQGAQALLLPSFAEGYGLPLAEALALGVPALCSDIPVFREVGCDVPEFIDPLDGPAWSKAIKDYKDVISPRRRAQIERLGKWRAPTWNDHFEKILPLLEAQQRP